MAPARHQSSLHYLVAFPMLIVPFALYNMLAFLLNLEFDKVVFSIPPYSGQSTQVSSGDILVILGVFLLFVEILKATRMSTREIVDHILSLVLLIAMLTEFMFVPQCATSTFLILLSISFVDVIGGFTVTHRAAQHEAPLNVADASG
jgi:hypothetical protein